MAFRSTSRPTCRIFPASCRAAWPIRRYGVTSLADLGPHRCRCRRSIAPCGANSNRCSARLADVQKLGSTENRSPGRRSAKSAGPGLALIDGCRRARPAGRRGTARSWSARPLPGPRAEPRPNRRGSCAPSLRRRVRARSVPPRRESPTPCTWPRMTTKKITSIGIPRAGAARNRLAISATTASASKCRRAATATPAPPLSQVPYSRPWRSRLAVAAPHKSAP